MKRLLLIILLLSINCTWFNKLLETPDKTRLQYIQDNSKRIIIYHGINIANSAKTSVNNLPWQTKEDFAKLNTWGFNFVRYIFLWEALEPIKGHYNTTYLKETLKRLSWLKDLGIDVIIDFHQDLYAKKFTGDGFPEWTIRDNGIKFNKKEPWNLNYSEPAVITSYTNFWKNDTLKQSYIEAIEHILKAIDTLDNVLGIDIMNEPFPGELNNFEKVILTDFYNKIQTTFLKINSTKKLFFEPVIQTSSGLPSNLNFTAQTKAIYAPHYYDPLCHENKPYKSENRRILSQAINIKIKESQNFKTPFMIGEWGIPITVENYNQFLFDFLNYTDNYCISWAYYSYDKGSTMSILDDTGNTRPNLNILSRVYPQKIGGINPTFNIIDTVFNLTYEKIETDAPTEIFIPLYRLNNITAFINKKRINLTGNKLIFYNDSNKIQEVKITWH